MADRLREELASIRAKVEEAKQRGAPIWPLNEANTERIVVEPVLKALGYGDLDYMGQPQGVGADYPDYIVLPGLDQRWILEVKPFDARLDERYERQAVNYANNNGAQWAVLTNGLTWWIYNTRVPGDLTQQRVYEVNNVFEADNAVETLNGLSRASIQGGELDKAYRAREIRAALKGELVGGNKRFLRVLQDLVGQRLDRMVSPADVQEAIESLLGVERSMPPKPIAGKPTVLAPTALPLGDWQLLSYLAADQEHCTGTIPEAMRVGGDDAVEVKTWRDVARVVVLRSGVLDRVSLPCKAGPWADRYFLNSEPFHATGAGMKAPCKLDHNGKPLFVELHYSAYSLCGILAWLLRTASLDPDSISVKVRRAALTGQD